MVDKCEACGTDKECMGGRSAHKSNWFCPNCEKTNDAERLTVPDGWRSEVERAIKRAEVFDDGSDGADAESARSVVAILRAMLTATPDKDTPARLSRDRKVTVNGGQKPTPEMAGELQEIDDAIARGDFVRLEACPHCREEIRVKPDIVEVAAPPRSETESDYCPRCGGSGFVSLSPDKDRIGTATCPNCRGANRLRSEGRE